MVFYLVTSCGPEYGSSGHCSRTRKSTHTVGKVPLSPVKLCIVGYDNFLFREGYYGSGSTQELVLLMSVKKSMGSFGSFCIWLRFSHITPPLIHST